MKYSYIQMKWKVFKEKWPYFKRAPIRQTILWFKLRKVKKETLKILNEYSLLTGFVRLMDESDDEFKKRILEKIK